MRRAVTRRGRCRQSSPTTSAAPGTTSRPARRRTAARSAASRSTRSRRSTQPTRTSTFRRSSYTNEVVQVYGARHLRRRLRSTARASVRATFDAEPDLPRARARPATGLMGRRGRLHDAEPEGGRDRRQPSSPIRTTPGRSATPATSSTSSRSCAPVRTRRASRTTARSACSARLHATSDASLGFGFSSQLTFKCPDRLAVARRWLAREHQSARLPENDPIRLP